ncbi:MAG: dienelactone hydrolase family protein [Gemmatimonadota bacterium]|nr:dienelactone hydrolase family protein [Gemmatimonadota bacterium]
MSYRHVTLMALAGTLACTGNAQQQAANDQQTTSAIPGAILGTAPAPQGDAVRYVPTDDATVGYLAVPDRDGPFPALILIHEWNGLVDRVRQVADAFAKEGYVALAADLYRGRTGSSREENRALTQEARGNLDAVIANLDAAQRFLRDRPDVTGKIGVMGWCFGGGIALSYGLGGEHHDATAIFYGSLIEDPEQLRALDHPVYGTFAENDRGIPPDQVERFAAALDAIGIENDIHVYDHVGHGFWLRVDGDRETREAPATDAWQRLKSFLARVLSS